MGTFRAQLKDSTLGSEYAYLWQNQSLLGRFIKKLFEIFCKTLFTIYCPLTVQGVERIPESSFIFCSNHNSHMDSAVLMTSSRKGFKNFGMIAAKDYFFDNKIRRYFLNLLMNLIPIDRKSSRKTIVENLLACRGFVKNGHRNLIVYPEGTRSMTGEMQPFKTGPAIISVELGLPIVPAYIEGTFDSYSKGSNFLKPKKVSITIGEPIYPEHYQDNARDNEKGVHFTAYRRVTKELEDRIHILKKGKIHGKQR